MMRTLLLSLLAVVALAACRNDLVCPQGEVDCGGKCVSLLTDAASCGACGHACGPLEACAAGTCGCAADVATCGGACTDLARDPANCGACGAACGAADYCTTAGGGTSCTASCPSGFTACGRACVDLTADVRNCGACGHACGRGESCVNGACGADIQVACFSTSDVRPVAADLSPAGDPRLAFGNPTVLALANGVVWAASGYPATVAAIPLDGRASSHVVLAGNDLEGIHAYGGAVLVSNVDTGTLVILDAASGAVRDELVLPGDAPNPHGIAVVGSTAYVALTGYGPGGTKPTLSGQAIATIDLAPLAACLADSKPPSCANGEPCGAGRTCRGGECRLPCGIVTGAIDLMQVAGTADRDAGGYPFPGQLAVRGSRVFAPLANLKLADCGGGYIEYCRPAGNGKLAVIDAAANGAVSAMDLGSDCRNPGDVEVYGSTLWVSCGSFAFPSDAPGRVVALDVSGAPALAGPAVDIPNIVPWSLAFCGGLGYVTDSASGGIIRFDPLTRAADAPVPVCPILPPSKFTFASDIVCR
jgi:hypothetical protein